MPYSVPVFDELTRNIIEILAPDNVLDIGCGAGKHGEIVRTALPTANLMGVEIEESYVERFKLNLTYDEVRVMSATEVMATDLDKRYDLVIIGDCIEHIPKSAGLDLLNFLTYRSAYTLVICPESVIQDTVDGVKSEAHISVWTERDFEWHDLWATASVMQMMLFLLRGYPTYPVSLPELTGKLNGLALPLNTRKFSKVCRLELHNRVRDETVGDRTVPFRCL